MAMDFFERQDHARRQTVRLLVMFAFSVVAIILAVYLAAVLTVGLSSAKQHLVEIGSVDYRPTPAVLWNPPLLLGVALGTILVIAAGSLYKTAELAAGGETVALMLGGRPINPQTTDLVERRLLNVVEEMALASGVPVPPVFVLENESSINAFAAGHEPGDAVVAVSRGCLDYLDREELQGVLGHEFSHILNGDMRLNLRLIGIVYGILLLSTIGYFLMRSAGCRSSSRLDRKDGGSAGLLLVGLAMFVAGYLGVFFGRLIRSAISRQREFLADASSVQFTRNPSGLAGALKKIAGLAQGSQIQDRHAAEIGHMFFSDASGSLFGWFATHPPLAERIRRLEPDFDGRLPRVRPLMATAAAPEPRAMSAQASAFSPADAVASPVVPGLAAGERVARHIGRPQHEHLRQASRVVAGMPLALSDATREPFAARAVIYVLLLSRTSDKTRARQWQGLQSQVEPPLYQQARRLAAEVDALRPETRLPLVNLTMPALKRLSPAQYAQFRRTVEALLVASGRMDLWQYCLRTVLFASLDVFFKLKKPPTVRYRSIDAVGGPATVVLSSLAYARQSGPKEVTSAFAAGAVELLGAAAILLPHEDCTMKAFDAALGRLAQASPQVKRAVISAAVDCVAADGKTTLEESELLRVIAAALSCPAPIGYGV
jgi:Zn-dependent protease with chaperone function